MTVESTPYPTLRSNWSVTVIKQWSECRPYFDLFVHTFTYKWNSEMVELCDSGRWGRQRWSSSVW